MAYIRMTGIVIGAILLSGCESILNEDLRLASAEPLFGRDLDQCMDDPEFVFSLLSRKTGQPAILEGSKVGLKRDRSGTPGAINCNPLRTLLHEYLFASEDTQVLNGSRSPKEQRNELIQALVGISNRKCGRYSAHIKTFDGQTNSWLSFLSIATGGVGSVVDGAQAARILSGASGIATGTRVAVNDAWFSNQTIQVLVAGYEKERNNKLRDIHHRQSCPIDLYPTMAGIADAIQYHGSCSLITGLAAAAQAIERSDQPGVEVMRRQLADLASIRTEASQFVNASVEGRPIKVQNQLDKVSFARQELAKADERVRIATRDKQEAEGKARVALLAAAATTGTVTSENSLLAAIANDETVKAKGIVLTAEQGLQDAAKTALAQAEKDLIELAESLSAEEKARSRFDDSYVARTYSEVVFCPFSTVRPGPAAPAADAKGTK